jgi:cytochrome c-type biogenesis protein CcmH
VRLVAVAALALALAAPAAACTPRASQSDLETKLVCIQCHTTLDESDSSFAIEMKQEIARQIRACRSEKQIIDFMVGEFGKEVLATPQTHGFDVIAWVLPIGGILLGALALAVLARQWARARVADATPAPQLDAEDERRVDEALARFE